MTKLKLRREEVAFPPCPSYSAMPPTARTFMREWIAAMKQMPVDHPTIQEIPITFEGFGETLYESSAYELESYLVKAYTRCDGATISLAMALFRYLQRSKEKAEKEYKEETKRLEQKSEDSTMVPEEEHFVLRTTGHETIEHGTIKHSTTEHDTIEHGSTEHDTTKYDTIKCDTTIHGTTAYNATGCGTTESQTLERGATERILRSIALCATFMILLYFV